MKFFNRLTAIIVVGVAITTTLPIAAAISIAQRQSRDAEHDRARAIAERVLGRSEIIADQLLQSSLEISALSEEQACSPAGLALMRTIALRSTMLRGVGWIDGNSMRCSSFMGTEAFELGPPDYISSTHAKVRVDIPLVDPEVSYLAVQLGHSVGVVHPDMPLSYLDDDVPGVAVSVFGWSTKKPLMLRGDIPQELYERATGPGVFSYKGSLVVVAKSNRNDLGALAILPPGQAENYALEAAKILIPIALVFGLLLSAVLVYVIRHRVSMPAMIRTALARRKFSLHYQPMIDLSTGKIVGAEALIRWDRGNASDIPTDRLIDAAEEAGLVPLITAHVMELLADDARAVMAVMPEFHFAVNLSASDLYRPSVLVEVTRLLEQTGIAPSNLVIEATERSLVDVDRARENLRRLRDMGVRMAIDDFGTGYSSLAYLAQIQADFLKIDRLFVQALGTGSVTSQVAARIIEMGKDLNLAIVAEGIETKRQERLLKNLGVEFAQGYLYGHAMALEDLVARLQADQLKFARRKIKEVKVAA